MSIYVTMRGDWRVRTVLDGFRKHDATSKTTQKWRGNGVIFPYMDVARPFSRRLRRRVVLSESI